MKWIASVVLLFFVFTMKAQNTINLVPMPADVKPGKGIVLINPETKLVLEGSNLEKCAAALNNYLQANFGYSLKTVKNYSSSNSITLNYERLDNDLPGAYNLTADKKGIYIAGDNEEGVFYGVQTLIQLIERPKTKAIVKVNTTLNVPYVTIQDHPRFAYRGLHLDVARHFFPVSYVKKYIDYLAAYKYNTFHWHLTDDQGWRIEIKKYPLLTSVGGYRNGTIIGRYPGKGNDGLTYGGYYTQEQVKEIVQYAAERYITVIPEIEMPGHASAAIAAYPQLSCFPDSSTKTGKTPWSGSKQGKQVQQTWGVFEDVFAPTDYTFNFLQDVLDEVMPLFPSKYIHIGGDECPKESWKRSPFCQQLIKDNNLKDEHGLQSYFIQHMEKYINSKGKQIIGWDEILEGGLAPNATVMSWRGEEGGIEAAKQNHDVIMTPGAYCYLDHSQSRNEDSVTIGGYLPLDKVYNYEPVPAVLNAAQAKHVLGAQGNLWTEYIGNPAKVEYMIFPRMIALSEVLWSPKEKRNWKDFERRLPFVLQSLDKKKVNYSKAYYDLQAIVVPGNDGQGVAWKLESKNSNAVIQYETVLPVGKRYSYTGPVPVTQNTIANAWAEDGATKSNIITQYFKFNKATGKKISLVTEASKNYPGDGAFTLVNGVQNELGLSKGNEFLGFLGKDCEGTIDLGKPEKIKTIRFHSLSQSGSWIYPPQYVEVSFGSAASGKKIIAAVKPVEEKEGNIIYEIQLDEGTEISSFNFKLVNFGIIPSGNPGAGTAAWLFVDEIEAE
ncbi:beta-N-acetylhexosaminidase [Ferruginibacter sp.]